MTTQNLYCSTIVVSILLVLLVFPHLIPAIKCFQCLFQDGVGDTGCADNPPPDKYLRLRDCTLSQCWYRYKGNGSTSVERNCSSTVASMTGCVSVAVADSKGSNVYMECKCNGANGCNGNNSGGSVSVSSGGVFISTNGQSKNTIIKNGSKKMTG